MVLRYCPQALIFLVSGEVRENNTITELRKISARRVSDFLSVLKRRVPVPTPLILRGLDPESSLTAEALSVGFNGVEAMVCEWLNQTYSEPLPLFERHYSNFIDNQGISGPLIIVAGLQQTIALITAIQSKTLVTKLKLSKGDVISFNWKSPVELSLFKLRTTPYVSWEKIPLNLPLPSGAHKLSKHQITHSQTM